MSLKSLAKLYSADLREGLEAQQSRLSSELGDPSTLAKGTTLADATGQLWRTRSWRGRSQWERVLTLTPAKRERMHRLIGYGRWLTFAYLLGFAVFYFARLEALSVGGMVPSYMLIEMVNGFAPAMLFVFFLRFLPKTAAVLREDGTVSPA